MLWRLICLFHYNQGVQAALEGVSHGGMLDLWLSHLKDVYEKYEEELDEIADKK